MTWRKDAHRMETSNLPSDRKEELTVRWASAILPILTLQMDHHTFLAVAVVEHLLCRPCARQSYPVGNVAF